jgi:nucleotide-binding universal stress UspA family protein
MRRVKNILVALDGSGPGLHALEESIRLAQWARGRVTVITVAPPYEGDLSLVGVRDIKSAISGPCEETLSKTLDVAEAMNFPIEVACEEGEPHEKILERAEMKRCDLIVVGADSRHPILGILLGSVMPKVIAQSWKDVLVIPERAGIDWEKMLLVADGSSYSEIAAVRAIDLAAAYGGELKVIFVPEAFFSKSKEGLSRGGASTPGATHKNSHYIRERAEKAGVRCEILARSGGVCGAVRSIVEQQGIGMIVTGADGRTGLKRLLMGGVAEKIIHSAVRPVFIAKDVQ